MSMAATIWSAFAAMAGAIFAAAVVAVKSGSWRTKVVVQTPPRTGNGSGRTRPAGRTAPVTGSSCVKEKTKHTNHQSRHSLHRSIEELKTHEHEALTPQAFM